MKRIKKLIDPGDLFNPGVLINDDPDVVSKNIKRTPPVSPRIDKCIECGFCEHVCPSRLVTLTPRGRIQASRKHAELLAKGDDAARRGALAPVPVRGDQHLCSRWHVRDQVPCRDQRRRLLRRAARRTQQQGRDLSRLGAGAPLRRGREDRARRSRHGRARQQGAHDGSAHEGRSQADPVLACLVAGDRQEPEDRCSGPRTRPRSSISRPV